MDRLTPIHHLIKEKSKIKDITKKTNTKRMGRKQIHIDK